MGIKKKVIQFDDVSTDKNHNIVGTEKRAQKCPELLRRFDMAKGMTKEYKNNKKIKQLDLRRPGDIGYRGPSDKGYGFDKSRFKLFKLKQLELKKLLNIDLSESELELELEEVEKELKKQSVNKESLASSVILNMLEINSPLLSKYSES